VYPQRTWSPQRAGFLATQFSLEHLFSAHIEVLTVVLLLIAAIFDGHRIQQNNQTVDLHSPPCPTCRRTPQTMPA
jgi:hypothetical protein